MDRVAGEDLRSGDLVCVSKVCVSKDGLVNLYPQPVGVVIKTTAKGQMLQIAIKGIPTLRRRKWWQFWKRNYTKLYLP